MKLRVASTIGKDTTMTVSEVVFNTEVSQHLIAQAVHVYLSNQRQGTSKTKTRGEIARTKKKWFKQKGTGNARHGARTPSLFVGGGVSHGPNGEQNWSRAMSQTMKRAALRSALTLQQEQILVCDDIAQLDGKTASAEKMLKKLLPEARSILIVIDNPSELVTRGVRNLQNVLMSSSRQLNTHDVIHADAIIFTKDAITSIETRLALPVEGEEAAEKPAKPSKAMKAAAKEAASSVEKKAEKKPAKKVAKVSKTPKTSKKAKTTK